MHNPWYKRIWIWISIIVILIILISIPFIINESYKASKGYITIWGAEDMLSFYGNLLAAAATIISVIITIRFTVRNQMQERKLTVKPFLQSESHPVFSPKEACSKQGNKTIYLTYPYDETESISSSLDPQYILKKRNNAENIKLNSDESLKMDKKSIQNFIKDNAIDLDSQSVIDFVKLSKLELDAVELLEMMTESVVRFKKEYYILEYNLSNVGAGTAVSIQFTINDKLCLPPFSLSVFEERKFVILLKSDLLRDNQRTIQFCWKYHDVVSRGRYKQAETIRLYSETEDGTLNTRQQIEDLISQPFEI